MEVNQERELRVYAAIDKGLCSYNPMRFVALDKREWTSGNGKYKLVATSYKSLERSPIINAYAKKGCGFGPVRSMNLPKYVEQQRNDMMAEMSEEWELYRDFLFYSLEREVERNEKTV